MTIGRTYWVEHGKLMPVSAEPSAMGPLTKSQRFRNGHVRLTTGELGSEVKWTVFSPCNASLFTVRDWLKTAVGPFVLRFFASGWFEEFHKTADEASARILDIIARGDRHFTTQTLIKEFDFEDAEISPFLKGCISGTIDAEEYTVKCVFEDTSQQFHVESVGAKSPIGRLYGTYLSTFPCRSKSNYAETVSRAYASVLETGKPRFDHVLAAMKLPSEEIYWVPYHRLLMPDPARQAKPSVLVISEIGGVDISII